VPTTTRDAQGATRALGRPAALRLGALGLVVAGLAALIIGVLVTGAVARAPIADPGALTRWGLPVAKAVSYLAASITIGLLVVVAFVLPSEGWPAETVVRSTKSDAEGRLAGPALAATRLAAIIGAVWVASSVAVIVFSYARIAGVPPTAPGFGEQLTAFVTQLDLLRRALGEHCARSGCRNRGCPRHPPHHGRLDGALALLALAPLALSGHAAGTRNHELAVDSLAAHLVGLTIWLGGLAALVLLSPRLGQHRAVAISRYSTLALWCFVAVAVSG
jgi:putative copper resistance protein D